MCKDFNGQLKLATHVSYHHQLLIIFFPKDCNPWLYTGKEF